MQGANMEPEIPSEDFMPEPRDSVITDSPSPGFSGVEAEEVHPGQANGPEQPYRGLKWIFVGPEGLRSGWSILIFLSLMFIIGNGIGLLLTRLHLITKGSPFSARQQVFFEWIEVGALLGAAAIMAVIERRSILDYNLRGPNRVKH